MTDVDHGEGQHSRRPSDFAGKLCRLIKVLHPRGEASLSDRAIAARVRANGGSISAGYVAELRTGAKRNPSLAHAQHLAAAFNVSAGYFTDPEVFERVSQELDRIEQLNEQSNDSQLIELATRTASLSEDDRLTLTALVRRELFAAQNRSPNAGAPPDS